MAGAFFIPDANELAQLKRGIKDFRKKVPFFFVYHKPAFEYGRSGRVEGTKCPRSATADLFGYLQAGCVVPADEKY